MARNSKKGSRLLRKNLKLSLLLLFIPITVGIFTLVIIGSGFYAYNLADLGSSRLVTDNWQTAATAMKATQPTYNQKFAYYRVKPGQTVEEVSQYFSVNAQTLASDNQGKIVPGTTVKIRPVESPFSEIAPNGLISRAIVIQDGDILRIKHNYSLNQPITTTIPELAAFLAPYGAITKTADKSYQINKAISIDGDIRVDITDSTVKELRLVSTTTTLASLLFDESSALIKNVTVTSLDPSTGKPDTNSSDGRSFIRMKNGRLDILNSTISYLGNGLRQSLTGMAKDLQSEKEGGTYGISWRIADDQLGSQIATGWVEDTKFEYNHFGAYSYGASGITWRGNHFYKNEVYGLDPHDDSNNALIENNVFEYNGKHGFIVSKRCNYNIIRNNTSIGNKLHGFMLHQDSAYNVIENNVSYGNVDNYVIYASNFNTIRDNTSYNPSSSHIRINKDSHNTFVTGNKLYGGPRGIYLYDNANSTYISRNVLNGIEKEIQTNKASNTFYGDNTQSSLNFDIAPGDTFIFGINKIDKDIAQIPKSAPLPAGYKL